MELKGELGSTLDTARRMIEAGAPCVYLRDGKILKTGAGSGVGPLIAAYETEPETLRGAVIVDKIVGKAAAMLAVLAGAAGVYGLTMSRAALDYLAARGIPAGSDVTVERIINRTGTGICPMEATVLELSDPAEALAALKATMARLAAGRA